jgi:hypothetical protein
MADVVLTEQDVMQLRRNVRDVLAFARAAHARALQLPASDEADEVQTLIAATEQYVQPLHLQISHIADLVDLPVLKILP